jgi:hypothetical protein
MRFEMKKTTLPDKPSELIRVAIADLEKCERSKKYTVDMGVWHTYHDKTCYVCLAGSVMAQTMGIDSHKSTTPGLLYRDEIPDLEVDKLQALNSLRLGEVGHALSLMDKKRPTGIKREYLMRSYITDRVGFKVDMRKLADDLEAAGL